MKIVVAVLGSPSLINLTVSVDVKQLEEEKQNKKQQQQNGKNSVRFRFGSPFSSKVMTCGHCLVTLCRFWPSDLFFYFFKTEKTLNNRSKKGINKERQGNPVRRITMPTSLQQAACLADN